ncbi:hypothetical protein [Sphingobium sp. KCTC 72723]|uniref:hypothetical protein n=1 Tax=Sphingobium sp. KCTC 72723 TaxID=2733867 RepID=UPI00165E111D|nr:hypothetical protein [Sphingobium sp. KCTC 72723]
MAYAYFKADGRVLSVSRNELDYQDDSIIVAELPEHLNANLIYLDLDTMQVKVRQPLEPVIGYNSVGNLPVGTAITFGENIVHTDDGSVEFEADTPETLVLFLFHPHYIEQFIEVQTGPEAA